MPEPVADVAVEILEFLLLAEEGYVNLKEIFASDRAHDVSLGRVEIQSDLLDEWRSVWREDTRSQEGRLKKFTKDRPGIARRMLRELAFLVQDLTDVVAFERKYLFTFSSHMRHPPQDVAIFRFDDLASDVLSAFRARAKGNINYIRQARLHPPPAKRESVYRPLLTLLRQHNENLRVILPPKDLHEVHAGHLTLLRKKPQKSLACIAAGAALESKLVDDPSETARYDDYAKAANFAAVSQKFVPAKPVYQFSLKDFHLDPSYELCTHETMALLFDYPVKHEKRVVLIEWMKDFGEGGRSRSEARRAEIYDLALLLAASKPAAMCVANCYGVIDDVGTGRLGLVLAPPHHIRGGLPRMLGPGSISKLRMPLSLRELILTSHRTPKGGWDMDLSIRFLMAKKLLNSVHVMHATSFTHKNLCLDSVAFWASRERSPNSSKPFGPSTAKPQNFDLENPQIIGFNYGRLEETAIAAFPTFSNPGPRPSILKKRPLDNLRPSHQLRWDAYYRHPDLLQNPKLAANFRSYHDLYSLGIMLLEIGYWDTVDRIFSSLPGVSDTWDGVVESLKRHAAHLDSLVGSTYGSVVRELIDLADVHQPFDCSKLEERLSSRLSQCYA